MEDQLISFETAKMAKEREFDLHYSEFRLVNMYRSEDEGKTSYLSEDELYGNLRRFDYHAPTQSLLQKWLREVHKIHLYITPGIEDEGDIVSYENPYGYSYILLSHLVDPYDNEDDEDDDLFKTYEEALEHGLQEALKLIKL